jgi:two-component system chemotaxis response regulator CheY
MGLAMKSCLIVDESKVIRLVTRKILEDLEFETEEATDGQSAVEACRRKMPSAILVEWNLPVLSGIDFLRALRSLPGGEAPRVLFCTVENDLQHIQEALKAGADEYVMKPFDSEIIRAKFAQVGLL